jgi:hypothetical protein
LHEAERTPGDLNELNHFSGSKTRPNRIAMMVVSKLKTAPDRAVYINVTLFFMLHLLVAIPMPKIERLEF